MIKKKKKKTATGKTPKAQLHNAVNLDYLLPFTSQFSKQEHVTQRLYNL